MKFPRLDIHSACLFITSDADWRRKIFIGGLVMLMPLVGWTTLLGYRKVAIDRLWANKDPVLSEWDGNYIQFFIEGFKSCLVIFTYLFPASVYFWYVIFTNNLIGFIPLLEIILILIIFPLFTPIALPFTVLYLIFVQQSALGFLTGISIIGLYGISVLWIPLGFLQVSLTGKYLSAFNIPKTLKFLFRNFTNYFEAWIDSSIISLIGHFCIPFSPWGVTWAYLAIVYTFNEVLYRDLLNNKRTDYSDSDYSDSDYSDSWFDKFSGDHWNFVKIRNKGLISLCQLRDGRKFSTINLGPFRVLLPRILEKLILANR